jgi:hypothetical protein
MGQRREQLQARIARRAARRAERAAKRAAAGITTALPPDRRRAVAPASATAAPAPTPTAHAAALPQPFTDIHGRPFPIAGHYLNQPIFVILSGPSLNTLDLSLLHRRRGVVTIGVNNSPAVIRTDFWTHVDPPKKFHDAIWRDPGCMKIVASTMLGKPLRRKSASGDGSLEWVRRADGGHMTPREMPNVIGYRRMAHFDPATYLSEDTVNWGVDKKWSKRSGWPRCLNVMLAVLKISYSLGFRTAYLIGCDWHMDGSGSGAPSYAFNEAKFDGQAASNNNAYRIMSGWFEELLPYFDAAGFMVVNANPQSHLHVFPKMTYEAAIEAATTGIPQDPLDCAGWYKVG